MLVSIRGTLVPQRCAHSATSPARASASTTRITGSGGNSSPGISDTPGAACGTVARSSRLLVLTLAAGLGLVTVVFTIFNAYVLRPFAIRDPYGIYEIVWHTQEAGGRTFRWSDYESIQPGRTSSTR